MLRVKQLHETPSLGTTVIAGALLSCMCLPAQAGGISVSGIRTYATEVLNVMTTQVPTPDVAYTNTNPLVSGSSPIVKLTLSTGGFFVDCPALRIFSSAGNLGPVAYSAALTGATLSATVGAQTCVYQLPALPFTVPASSTLQFTGTGSTVGAQAALQASQSVLVTAEIFDAAGNPTNDGNTAVLVQSAAAFAISAQSSAALAPPEQSKIDITTAGGKLVTNPTDITSPGPFPTTTVNLGSITVTDLPGAQFDAQATPQEATLATMPAQNLQVEVTGAFTPNPGSSFFVMASPACNSAVLPGSLPGAIPAGVDKISLAGVDIASVPLVGGSKTVYLCYGTGSAVNPISPSAFTLTARFSGLTPGGGPGSQVAPRSVSNVPLYTLVTDGAQVDLRQFWSVATSNANGGWVQLIRIINTGNAPAVVRAQYIEQNTGAFVGSALPLNSTAVPAGGVLSMTAAQVEAVLGAPPAGIHRLRITAPTPSLRVQSFLRDPGMRHTTIGDQGVEANMPAATGDK